MSRFLTYANAELPNAALVIRFCIEQGEIQGDITPFHGVVTWTGRCLVLITARFPSPLWSPRQSLALHYSVIARCRRIRNIRPSLSTLANIIQHLLTKRGFADREFKVSGVFPLYPVLPTQVGLYVNIAKNRDLRTKRCTFTRCLDVMTFEAICRLLLQLWQFWYFFFLIFYIFCCVRWRNKLFSLHTRLLFFRWKKLITRFQN